MTGIAGGRARAERDQVNAEPARTLMKSRRLIASPSLMGCADEVAMALLQQGFAASEMGPNGALAILKGARLKGVKLYRLPMSEARPLCLKTLPNCCITAIEFQGHSLT